MQSLKSTGAMVIDEAHRAVSAMYEKLLSRAESICGPDLFPICGLTATPGRAGITSYGDTIKLVDRFETYLIKPELGGRVRAQASQRARPDRRREPQDRWRSRISGCARPLAHACVCVAPQAHAA